MEQIDKDGRVRETMVRKYVQRVGEPARYLFIYIYMKEEIKNRTHLVGKIVREWSGFPGKVLYPKKKIDTGKWQKKQGD